MAIRTVKISELTPASSPDNLTTVGNITVDGKQSTYKVDMGFMKDAANTAIAAAGTATAAASAADAARSGIQGDLGKLQSQIDQINQYQFVYGVEKEITAPATAWTRVGNMALHRSLPIQSKMYRCLLKDDGTENYRTHPDNTSLKEDGSPAVLDGTDGQVEVWVPWHYRANGIKDNKYYCYMSEYPFPGSYLYGGYVSAYHASIDRTDPVNPKLCSVVNKGDAFRGGNNNAAWDGTYRDLRGMPGTSTDQSTFRTYARNRGVAGKNGAGWNKDVYELMVAYCWLYVVEYANANIQAAYNAALTSEGFRQGGLGSGVTVLNTAMWANYNNSNPVVPCGYTNSLGNNTGTVPFAMPAEYGDRTMNVPSYRGIENPFGHINTMPDGCLINIQSDAAGGRSELYVCDDPAKFSSVSYADYQFRGLVAREAGYITEIIMGKHGDIIAHATGGSSSTYFADSFATAIPASGTSLRGATMSGSASFGTGAGLTFLYANYSPTQVLANTGARLCFIPE